MCKAKFEKAKPSLQILTGIPKQNISNLSQMQKLMLVKVGHLTNPRNVIVLREFIPTKCDTLCGNSTKYSPVKLSSFKVFIAS